MKTTRIGYAAAAVLALTVTPAVAQVSTGSGATKQHEGTQRIAVGAVVFYDWTHTSSPQVTDAAGKLISPNAGTSRPRLINF